MVKHFLPFMIVACALAQTTHAPNTLTPEEQKNGWILLFDGKSMAGWVDPRQKTPPGDAWSVDDGCLHALKRPHLVEDLFTKDTFRDFELAFEWKISSGGNSGVKYRIQDHFWILPADRSLHERFEQTVNRSVLNRRERPSQGQDYVVGFEYQLTDDTSNRDAKSNPKHTAGALYDMVQPSTSPLKPVGEWNQSRIVVEDNHVEHWLNGVRVVDSRLDSPAVQEGIQKRWAPAPRVLELLSEQPRKDCPISLQNHDDEAWFRNIKVRRISR
jgi:hypothetical protein